MNYILTSAQMRAVDRKTIEELGIPSQVLMETAGKAIAEDLAAEYMSSPLRTTVVFCGKGNNGGDGAVIARWLHVWGHLVSIVKVGSGQPSPEAQLNFDLCEKLGIEMFHYEKAEQINDLDDFVRAPAFVVDAVFGTGFKGELNDDYRVLFDRMGHYGITRFAVDMPSWIDADTGFARAEVIINKTYAIGAYKPGHFIGYGSQCCGDVELVDIGIPRDYYFEQNPAFLADAQSCEFPDRVPFAYKGLYGRVMIFGGSIGYTGAATMAARAALRAGAGLVYVLARIETLTVYESKLDEAICLLLEEDEKTEMPLKKELLDQIAAADCIVIGPGLGLDDYALKVLTIVMENCECPVLIDADALTLISRNAFLMRHITKPNILLTPHLGEFQRLSGVDVQDIINDPLGHLGKFVAKHQARVLLKSFYTIYKDPDTTYINISGNDGLATGGSGDVLSGIIASLIAQGLDITEAPISASYLMGITAEALAKKRDAASILPTDIIENLFVYESEAEE